MTKKAHKIDIYISQGKNFSFNTPAYQTDSNNAVRNVTFDWVAVAHANVQPDAQVESFEYVSKNTQYDDIGVCIEHQQY